MEEWKAALQRGKEERMKINQLQDEVLTLFVNHIQKIDDKETLEAIKKELEGCK